MAITTANHVAHALINLSHAKRSPITNLKLQKLLYYAQAWFLVLKGESLFDEPIEAWVHGPVVPTVFKHFRDCRWNAIPRVADVQLSVAVRQHLDEIWNVYGKFDATSLENLAHSEDPWKETRGGLPMDAPSHNIIPNGKMKTFYRTLLRNG